MSVPEGDFAATLRSQVREALANPPAAEPTPAAETPTPEVTPEVVAEPTPAPESPSVVEAAPSPAPEGNPPPAQPSPASDVPPTTSAVEALTKRGFNVTDEKLAAEYLRIESEFAAMKRAEKAAAKAPAADPQPVTQPPAIEATPAPAPLAPVAAAPEPPAAQPQAPVGVDQEVAQIVAGDPTCVAFIEDYRALGAELETLWKVDRHGRPVGGQILDLNNKIASLEQILKPNEGLKSAGIPLPELDPIQKGDLDRALYQLKLDRRDLIDAYNGKRAAQISIQENYGKRVQSIREPYENAARAKAEAEQRDAEIETKAQAFERTWLSTEATAFKTHNVQERHKSLIGRALKLAARSDDGPITPEEIPAFMDRVIQRELAELSKIEDEGHRQKMAEYARLKSADAQAATQAPNGNAAVAAPSPTNHQDWQRRLKAEVRAALH